MHSIAWWPTAIVLVIAAFNDLRSYRIPTWLALPFFATGITVSGWTHGWHGIEKTSWYRSGYVDFRFLAG